ncbi:hypothetical protein F441_17607 [Phytophthora nicotianae CJ01A1]|uniref:Uncharacterized protein n=1 Tax=Phytophthora nicotianae CJ01A1 TaxID=1317063 RepID=W2W5U4_PHYNI|nr:hypothetical protein F441_17607 [Phytophthora nicotianae CJ01A1]
MQLLQQGLSQCDIRAIIPVGGSRVDRLRKIRELGPEAWHTRRSQAAPWHAFSDEDIEAFKLHCATWILEDGFPCAHRRPRQYFTEPNLTWVVVHAHYVDDITRNELTARTLSYTLGLRNPTSEAEKKNILQEKTTQINEAVAQNRFVSAFIKSYTALHAPDQQLPDDIIPDTYDSCDGDTIVEPISEDDGEHNVTRVQIQA